MAGNYFGFTPGGSQYSNTFATAPGYHPTTLYGFTPSAAAGYATSFQQAPGTGSRPEPTSVFTFGTRPNGGGFVGGGASAVYAAPLTVAAASGVASVIAGLTAAAATKTPAASTISSISAVPNAATTASSSATSTYTGYDAAVYAAATSYLQSKAAGSASQWLGVKRSTPIVDNTPVYTGFTGSGTRPSFPRKTNVPPRTTQLHYCEICKISCAGPQTYREHLEGQKHKKKEALVQGGETQPLARSKTTFRCDLCSVTCTGQDTYQAHVRGAKHQKTLKLHQTLGKPIPNMDPVIIPPANASKAAMVGGAAASATQGNGVKKIVGVPRVEFIGGQKLTTTGMIGTTEVKMNTLDDQADTGAYSGLEKEPQPVGEEYVQLTKTEDGKGMQYFCKLCNCRFNDMNAKGMHLKGRPHRLEYKKRVNPQLEVEMKVVKGRRVSEEKYRKGYGSRDMWGAPPGMYQQPMMPYAPMPMQPVPLFGSASSRPMAIDNKDEQYILAKHAAIYPSDDETKAILTMVTNVERALKTISDHLAVENKDNIEPGSGEERLLKGAMRVGVLAKGLLLRGDPSVQLVVLCSEKPTRTLLKKVAELLPQHLEALMGTSAYEVQEDVAAAAINVESMEEKMAVIISLTSIYMRDPADGEGGEAANKRDPIDVLDKQKCLEALASLRHAKWFQARCVSLQSCPMMLRIFRDLCQRVPAWMPLTTWATELLVEKVLYSANVPLGPAEAFRRIFEAIASGILLPGGLGLQDPCEKVAIDATANLQKQQREDMTVWAQTALRKIAFKQIYEVLGIDRSAINGSTQRKRPLDQEDNEDFGHGKKDKKDESMDPNMV